jgi:transcriptional regulator with XRE-family HTH domain
MHPINQRIMDYIASKGYTKSDFAKSIDVSPSIMSHISSGRNKVGTEILQKIAIAHKDISLTWLLTGEGKMIQESLAMEKKEMLSKMAQSLQELKLHVALIERNLKELKD